MSPKTGRPTENPKKNETRIRMTDEDIRLLTYCSKKLQKTKSDIIRMGIREVYEKIK